MFLQWITTNRTFHLWTCNATTVLPLLLLTQCQNVLIETLKTELITAPLQTEIHSILETDGTFLSEQLSDIHLQADLS
jgi:hypothetical protein